jgi:hypothetical protein
MIKRGGEIGRNDNNFEIFEAKARKYYLKKWGSWIKNDDHQHPILIPVYKKKLIIKNTNPQIEQLYDWFNGGEDIIVTINGNTFTQNDMQYFVQLNQIIADSGEIGEFKLGNMDIKINKIEDISNQLIKVKNEIF